AVAVVHSAVTGAHEQFRLREPGYRAAKMSVVHGEDQELRLAMFVHTQVADVDSRECGHPVPRLAKRVIKGFQPGFVDRESVHLVQGDPANLSLAQAEEVADQRHTQDSSGHGRQTVRHPLEEGATRGTAVVVVRFDFHYCSPLQLASSATRSVTS